MRRFLPAFFHPFTSFSLLSFPFLIALSIENSNMKSNIRLAVFASGNGSNAQRIYDYFKLVPDTEISAIYSNKADAYVLERAKSAGIPSVVFDRQQFYHSDIILQDLQHRKIDWIILAGFLWLIPESILQHYPGRIINIHPALLPKFGGKGMYGERVHQAVVQSGEKESGITIHFVNEKYDEGQVIFQAKCVVDPAETAESLAKKIHELEHRFFPEIIDKLIHAES